MMQFLCVPYLATGHSGKGGKTMGAVFGVPDGRRTRDRKVSHKLPPGHKPGRDGRFNEARLGRLPWPKKGAVGCQQNAKEEAATSSSTAPGVDPRFNATRIKPKLPHPAEMAVATHQKCSAVPVTVAAGGKVTQEKQSRKDRAKKETAGPTATL